MSGGVVPVSIIAKDYGMTAMAFNRLLHHLGIDGQTACGVDDEYVLAETACLGQTAGGRGDPEVGDLPRVAGSEDVLWLDVRVDQSGPMNRLKASENLVEELNCLWLGQSLFSERSAVAEFERETHNVSRFLAFWLHSCNRPPVEELHHIRMVNPAGVEDLVRNRLVVGGHHQHLDGGGQVPSVIPARFVRRD